MVDNSDQDKIHKIEHGQGSTFTRWRGLTSSFKPATPNPYCTGGKTEKETQPNEDDGDLEHVTDVDITLIQKRTYFLSAWIGDTNRTFNKYKGWIGLFIWLINIAIHFSLDFYEANFVFNISWATCIGLFFVTLVVGCACMIKYSVPWFIKGVKKLKKDGHYPKTLRRLRLIMRLLPLAVPVFACGAAMGQFGCYWADGALKLSFGCKNVASNNSTCEPTVPPAVETMFNVFRATSLVHIFYGFALLLMFHMTLIFMIQSSMTEFNKRMAHMFRENPTDIAFPEAVNLFSARSRFVREGSKSCMIVLTTLLVACSTSFVLNAYNFLFQKRFAIYIWFALAPLIWAVVPLLGAAWVTKTYHKYKLVVVNAWVDIPEEHELEAQAHEEVHKAHANDKGRAPSPSPARRMWSSMINRKDREKDRALSAGVRGSRGDRESDDDDGKKEKARTLSADMAKRKWGSVVGRKGQNDNGDVSLISVKARNSFDSNDKPSDIGADGKDIEKGGNAKPIQDEVAAPAQSATSKLRKGSEISLHFASHPSNGSIEDKKQSAGLVQVQPHGSNPQIMLTDYDGKRERNSSNITTVHETCSESSLVDIEYDEKANEKLSNSLSSGHSTPTEENRSNESGRSVKIDMEGAETTVETKNEETGSVALKRPVEKSISLPANCLSNRHSLGDASHPSEFTLSSERKEVTEGSDSQEMAPSRNVSLKVPTSGNDSKDSRHKPNLMIGMAKTFHKWRTKTKKKRKFNFEKYITYLESILPTVGFSVGGVVITWDGVSFFTVLLLTLVGIFAQEAFFGS